MRYAFYTFVILFSISALAGGYFSGKAAVPHITLQSPAPDPSVDGIIEPDELAQDDFATDPAVMTDGADGAASDDSHLAIVLVDCGHSLALETPFLELGIPVTLAIDPNGPVAVQLAHLAERAGKAVYVQAGAPVTPVEVHALHGAFSRAAGIASRLDDSGISAAALAQLHVRHLRFFDEYSRDARQARLFAKAGVRYAGRSITVDDHLQPPYVGYMFGQAVHLGRGSTAVVLARPLPGTLRALQKLIAHSSEDGVWFVRLP